jgi:SAM-dependent methyltransferase
VYEHRFWSGMTTIGGLLAVCAGKPEFLTSLGDQLNVEAWIDKDVLEVGVGPLGIAVPAFYAGKDRIRRLVKVDSLPRTVLSDALIEEEAWAAPFIRWVRDLAREGEYLQQPAEEISFSNEFDTVITYNVLDHVRNPSEVLRKAWEALRAGGLLLVAVDCRSMLGKVRFDLLTRRLQAGSILVEAHPYTFVPKVVVGMIQAAGFADVRVVGLPRLKQRLIGHQYRPTFSGRKL